MKIVGVDSGTTGAFSVIDTVTGAASVHDLPMEAVKVGEKMRNKLEALEFARMLRRLCPVEDGAVAYLEALHARGSRNDGEGQSMMAQGAMMECYGGVRAALQIVRLRIVPVYPSTWKRALFLSPDKDASRTLALRLYPPLAADLKRIKDHNRAEAVLIGHFGRSKEH